MVKTAFEYSDGPIALRYPRGNGLGVPMDEELKTIPIGTWEVLKEGTQAAILTFGTTIPMAMKAAEVLAQNNISVEVINARFIKPLDTKMLLDLQARNIPIITVEESALQGGFGSAVLELYNENDLQVNVHRIGIPDIFIEHGEVNQLLEEIHVTTDEIVKVVTKKVNEPSRYIPS